MTPMRRCAAGSLGGRPACFIAGEREGGGGSHFGGATSEEAPRSTHRPDRDADQKCAAAPLAPRRPHELIGDPDEDHDEGHQHEDFSRRKHDAFAHAGPPIARRQLGQRTAGSASPRLAMLWTGGSRRHGDDHAGNLHGQIRRVGEDQFRLHPEPALRALRRDPAVVDRFLALPDRRPDLDVDRGCRAIGGARHRFDERHGADELRAEAPGPVELTYLAVEVISMIVGEWPATKKLIPPPGAKNGSMVTASSTLRCRTRRSPWRGRPDRLWIASGTWTVPWLPQGSRSHRSGSQRGAASCPWAARR